MKRLFIIGLVLLALLQTQCGDMFLEHNNKKMNNRIEGEWKIAQITYKRASVGKPDSVVYDAGTIRLTPDCADGVEPTSDYCSHYAYCKPANQTSEYEMRWRANYDMNKEHSFHLEVYYRQIDLLQLGQGGMWDIVEITKKRFVVTCDEKEIVFTK
jgi:hypothetical protein